MGTTTSPSFIKISPRPISNPDSDDQVKLMVTFNDNDQKLLAISCIKRSDVAVVDIAGCVVDGGSLKKEEDPGEVIATIGHDRRMRESCIRGKPIHYRNYQIE